VLPAGEPASVVLAALAPDLILGVTGKLSPETRALLGPEAAELVQVPRLNGRQDVTEQVQALHPDLIVDYGDVTPAYMKRAAETQAKFGVPTLLVDGALERTPAALRLLGAALHREARAEALARFAEALLALPVPGETHRVVYLRGAEDFRAIAPGTGVAAVFSRLGWTVLAPAGTGTFRPATQADVAALDPDILVFGDARMRGIVAASPDWLGLRAVREGHAYVAPSLPFGWVEEPPSLNQLLGLAWLGGHDPVATFAAFDAVAFGHAPTSAELQAVAEWVKPLRP
jgi:iron complex transport system substrate-binding protein